jgi:hypothetical protein
MLKWMLRRRIAAFEGRFGYDMSYARDLLEADARAFLALAMVTGMSGYRRDVPVDVYYAAKLTAALDEDCGPCTQLVVGMALRDGVPAATLAALLSGLDDDTPEPVRHGAAFTRAVLAHDADATLLRAQIIERYGARGLASLSLAIAAARVFPTVKYALGHGAACQRVVVAGRPVAIRRAG